MSPKAEKQAEKLRLSAPATYAKLVQVLETIKADPRVLLHQAERLRHCRPGGEFWSRRLSQGDGLVYEIVPPDTLIVIQCVGNYDDR